MRFLIVAVIVGAVATSGASSEELALSELSHIHGVGFDASEPGSILLATHYGVYRADSDGKAEAISVNADDYMGFSLDPGDSDRLLASGHPGQGGNLGVIQSTDGGVTWNKISDGVSGPVDFHAMSISRADPKVIYGLFGGIQISRDGGSTWTLAGPAPGEVIDLAAAPMDVDTLFAGTAQGLMVSKDGATSWTLAGPDGVATTMVESAADSSLYVFFAGTGLYRLAPEGSWAELSTSFGAHYLLHLAADPADPAHLVAVTEESAVLESRDGGKTWKAFGT
ncbi:WD40/YVTN/BNR-like repeat-containing protein [Devosia sp.]|uniref:WD40/YVTN/BNR-like repeat-containing protein n=1 Tax=Devosia sp. TaxID=1871048 RepID=UPI003F71559D